jgi:hypothetical protein
MSRMNRMNTGIIGCAVLLLAAGAMGPAWSQTIAITEFLNNANGEDDGAEWVELYNYGDSAIDLTGWTISDEDIDTYSLDGLTIEAHDFLVLVGGSDLITGTEKKFRFELEWLDGVSDDRVIGIDQAFAFGNSSDELIITDNNATVVWNLAYGNDETNSFSTFLTVDDYSVTDFGNQAAPGIVRHGDDNGMPGFLGYESQDSVFASDPNAYVSANDDTGSPFLLSVSDVPMLTVTGTCPGTLTIDVTNAEPGGNVAIVFARSTGSVSIPGGFPCAGTLLGLDGTAQLVATIQANALGVASISRNVPGVACSGVIQALDVANCLTTNTATLQ